MYFLLQSWGSVRQWNDFIPRAKNIRHIHVAHVNVHIFENYSFLRNEMSELNIYGVHLLDQSWWRRGNRFKCNVKVQGYTFKGLVEKWSPILWQSLLCVVFFCVLRPENDPNNMSQSVAFTKIVHKGLISIVRAHHRPKIIGTVTFPYCNMNLVIIVWEDVLIK